MTDNRPVHGDNRLRELHHAATDIMSASDVQTVYQNTVETAERVLGFDFCSVVIPADDGFEVAASSHWEQGRKYPVEGGILDRTFREQQGFLVRDIEENLVAEPIDTSFKSGISVPIGDTAVLQSVSITPEYYDTTDLELAELLTIHAEAALEQVRSHERIREQKHKIEELHTVATNLPSYRTKDELFELMKQASQEILGFSWCTLYTIEDGEFVVAMASESSPMEVDESPFPEGNSKARDVLETGESHVVTDVTEIAEGEPTTDRMRSALQVPVGDIGVYNAAHERPGVFDHTDLELAELLASSVAEAYKRIDTREQLSVQASKLKRKNERLSQFASMVSHDLRNPLTVAQLRTELMNEGQPDEDTEALQDALARIETIIDDMLRMARAGETIQTTDRCSLADIASTAWTNTQTAGADLTIDLENATVEADRNRLLHVFENLFRNAVEHGSPSSASDDLQDGARDEPSLVVTVGPLEDAAGFYIEDNGHGLPDDNPETLFTYGYTTSEQGTGYGLAFVHDIVTAHGWTITATESEKGGARFEIGMQPD